MSGQQSKTYPKTLYTFSAYFPLTIFLISFSLFSASIGVRLFTSRFNISSRIWQRIGSSNWKKLNCIPPRFSLTSANQTEFVCTAHRKNSNIQRYSRSLFQWTVSVVGYTHSHWKEVVRHVGYINRRALYLFSRLDNDCAIKSPNLER